MVPCNESGAWHRFILEIAAAAAIVIAGISSPDMAIAQGGPTNNPVPNGHSSVTSASHRTPPLAIYGLAGIACTAATTIVLAAITPRELTHAEVMRNGMTCFLGPPGWFLAGALYPELNAPPRGIRPGGGRGGFGAPPAGAFGFVPDEVLLRVRAGTSDAYVQRMAQRLGLTLLETQIFALTGQSVQRWRVDSGRSVAAVISALSRYTRVVSAQSNNFYRLQQSADGPPRAPSGSAQYVVDKLQLSEVHRLTAGDGVAVAVIDSLIDETHPDLTGAVAARFDATGEPAAPHGHGTGMAGAVAAKGRLTGVAPRARLLAVRAFGSRATSADATTFNILKGLDWAAGEGARIVNMSFAGPRDPLMAEMVAAADKRGIVLIAAVGNAGPRSPPLYPAAYREVIGVTATDAGDRLLTVANRGPQVAVAAPGVDVLLPSPGNGLQVASGTSAASAHVSGVAALMLSRNPSLRPADVRRILTRTASVPGSRPRNNEYGAGLVDPLKAVDAAGVR